MGVVGLKCDLLVFISKLRSHQSSALVETCTFVVMEYFTRENLFMHTKLLATYKIIDKGRLKRHSFHKYAQHCMYMYLFIYFSI